MSINLEDFKLPILNWNDLIGKVFIIRCVVAEGVKIIYMQEIDGRKFYIMDIKEESK